MRSSAELFKALADETRLRILNLLVRAELCVCDITAVLGIGQSKASRHLACLRNVGLVEDRREGVWTYYVLARPKSATHRWILRWLRQAAVESPRVLADLRALRRVQRGTQRCGVRGDGGDRDRGALLVQDLGRG